MGPSPGAIRDHLHRILASQAFRSAERSSRLLAYLVNAVLSDSPANEPLKEYRIALDVFARPDSFNPRTDSIVRISARELRFKLRDYYQDEGAAEALRIDLPKGSYRPEFREVRGAAAARPARWRRLAAALLVTGILAASAMLLRAVRSAGATTVAVLPFDNLSDDKDAGYVCLGLVDELSTALANVRGLRVVARTSAANLRQAPDAAAAARGAGVSAILEGSVRKTGGRYRITAQLIETASGYHRWAETYVEEESGIPMVIEAVTRGVARTLEGQPPAAVRSGEPAGAESRRLYWKGRALRQQRGDQAVVQAAEAFQEVVRREPGFAAGWAALAEACNAAAFHQIGGFAEGEAVRRARQAALRALDLDPQSQRAHATLAAIAFFHDHNWPDSEQRFRRALELNPSDARTRYWYALGLLSRGRTGEAVRQARQARDLDPLSYTVSNNLASVLYCARRFDESMQLSREALAADPSFTPAHAMLGLCLSALGRHREAAEELEQALAASDRYSYLLGRLGHAYARLGRESEARQLLAELQARGDAPNVSRVHIAYVHLALGETRQALDALERGFAARDGDASFVGVDPVFDPLRAEPRFTVLVERARKFR